MATAHGRKLACDLILTHFGDIVHVGFQFFFFLFSIFHKFSIGMCHVCVYVFVVNWYSVVRHWQRICCRWPAWTNLLKSKENFAFSPVAANINYLNFECGMRNQEISMCLALASDTVTYVELNLCYGVVQKVCRCLVNGGPLSIGDIGRLAEVNPHEVENSIVVLLQHNCVQGFKRQQQEDGNAGKNPSQSSPVLDSSVLRHWCQFGVTPT